MLLRSEQPRGMKGRSLPSGPGWQLSAVSHGEGGGPWGLGCCYRAESRIKPI